MNTGRLWPLALGLAAYGLALAAGSVRSGLFSGTALVFALWALWAAWAQWAWWRTERRRSELVSELAAERERSRAEGERALEEARRLSREAALRSGLLSFAQALASVRDVSTLAEYAVSAGAPLALASKSALLMEDDRGDLFVAARSGFCSGEIPLTELEPRVRATVWERAPARIEGPLVSGTLVPSFYGRELMAVFLFEHESEGLDLVAARGLADLLAAALKNARLFESLSASEAACSALWEDSSDLALTIEKGGLVRQCNDRAARRLGFAKNDLPGSNLSEVLAPESVSAWKRAERELFRGGRLRDLPLRLRSREGRALELLVQAVAVPATRGGPRRARLSMRDRTELQEIEHQLRQSQKLEVVGALAGGIAHDFNNVLGGILGYASLLRSHLHDRPIAARYVETIERSAVRGAELTGRLLSASRKAPARREPVHLNLLLEETLELLERSFHKRVRIEKRLDPALRSMLADASQLQQVILNLCVNARDAMPEGGLLRVSTRLLNPGDRVELSVADTGVGMDAKTLSMLFEPFFSTKGASGTGLGLSVVHGIVGSLGGEVRVKSSPGRGARFDVVLPCQWASPASSPREAEEVTPGQGERILLVDDEKVLRDLGKEILESHGYRVAAVASGEEALAFLEDSREPVDLVLLDVVMPGLGGDETYRRVRKLDPGLPVLLSSGLTAEEGVQDVLREGAAGFIPKPYGIPDLTRAVSEALRRHKPTFV